MRATRSPRPTGLATSTSHPAVTSSIKRMLDILGALVGLILTALLLPLVGIAIYLDDPGPIFYRQQRVGLKGKCFLIWKFRSMVRDAEEMQHLVENQANGYIFKNERDPRVTRVGQFLRQSSLDEFPQFWNVLRGEMSLVGTRPPTVCEVKQYEPHHWQRLDIKPGLTGEWQVNGRSDVKDFEEVVRMDLYYLHRWSIAYDLQIIAQTVLVVLRRTGAV
ncbi:sugar transferase [Rubidibacter lacunae]|uniref:sugar transferase n=1 Tax=Rubidibacter lacunae TaxID=582514 RepID=UPI000685B28D|nr:sugar transferase [Rubidibacter lacunae]